MKIRWVESGNTRLLITATVVSKPSIGRRKTQTQLHRCANKVCKFINGKLTPAWHPKPLLLLLQSRVTRQSFSQGVGQSAKISYSGKAFILLGPHNQNAPPPPTHPLTQPGYTWKKQYWKIGKVLPVFKICLTSTVFVYLSNTSQTLFSALTFDPRFDPYKKKEFVLGYLVASL